MSEWFSTILCASLFVLTAFAYSVEAQSTVPEVDIVCETTSVQIKVHPGANTFGYSNCIVSNPTLYQEEVEITVLSDGLPNTGSSKVNIGPGGEVEIQLSFKAEIGMLMQSRSWSVEAVVVSANGVPPPNNASSKLTGILYIMQYSDLSIISSESVIDVNAGSSFEVEVLVENLGNQVDFFSIGLDDSKIMEDEGFIGTASGFRIQIEPRSNGGQIASIIFEITAPDKVGKVDSFYIGFYATSEFSCRYEGMCNTQYASAIISLSEDGSGNFSDSLSGNTVMIIGAIIGTMVVAAVVVVLVRRKTSNDIFEMSEEDDDFGDDFDDEFEEDDFEDDLEDDFFDDL